MPDNLYVGRQCDKRWIFCFGWMGFFGGGGVSTERVFLCRDELNSIEKEWEMRYFFDSFFDLKKDVYPLSRFIDSSINLQTSQWQQQQVHCGG